MGQPGNREQGIAALREYLGTLKRITAKDPIGSHRLRLENIWEKSIDLARGNPAGAALIALEATRTAPLQGERSLQEILKRRPTKEEVVDYSRRDPQVRNYLARLDAIPSQAFAPHHPSVDSVQHYFAGKYIGITGNADPIAKSWVERIGASWYRLPPKYVENTREARAAKEQLSRMLAHRWEQADRFRGKGYSNPDKFVTSLGARVGHILSTGYDERQDLSQLSIRRLNDYYCDPAHAQSIWREVWPEQKWNEVLRNFGHPKGTVEFGPITMIHAVSKADTLWDLAERYYGDPHKWPTIYNANKHVIGNNPDLIGIGQRLTIPNR